MPPKKAVNNNPINTTTPISSKMLDKFLAQFVYDKNIHKDGHTNTKIGDKKLKISGGTWRIPNDRYSEFLNVYYNECIANKKKVYFTEKQLIDEGPIAIDLDFRHDVNTDERQYTINHIINFIEVYMSKIEELFELVDDDIEIPLYVFEKPKVNQLVEKKLTKDGLHFIIGLNCNRCIQQIIREFMLEEMEHIFGDLPIIDSWTWENVYDDGVTNGTVNWQLYGSRKPGNDKYELTHVFMLNIDVNNQQFIRSEIPLNEFDVKENIDKLSVRYTEHDSLMMNTKGATLYKDFKIKNERKKNELQIIQTNYASLPTDFSFESILNNCNSKENIETLYAEFLQNAEKQREDEIHKLSRFVNILPSKFYGNGSYDNWIRTCWALKHSSIEFGNPYKLFIVWLYFSSKADSFDPTTGVQECLDKWNTANVLSTGQMYKGVTRYSIYHWAKEYAYEEYQDIMNSSISKLIEESLSSVDGDGDCNLAIIMRAIYKEDFICVSITKNLWYMWDGHYWKEDDGGQEIRSHISNELKSKFFDRSLELMPRANRDDDDDEDNEDEKQRNKNKLIRCHRIMTKCGSCTGKSKIHRELAEAFRDKDGEFLSSVNQNPYLFGCKNGIIDFQEKKFRPGRPDDYITIITPIDYEEFNPAKHQTIRNEINEFFNKIFPIKELCDYAWEHFASLLIGITPDQTFNIYIGEGQNGKSVLMKLLQKVLGNYTKDVSTTLVTDKKMKMGQASPEYATFPGLRYLCMTESDETEEIYEGNMKQLTGGDKLSARGLYEKKIIEFVPQFKLVLACNVLPPIKATDHGTWRRIRTVPFLSLFTEKPVQNDKKKPYQFKVDKTIEQRFDTWAPVLLTMLVEIAYRTDGRVKDCDTVLQKCKEYRNDSDTVARYIDERIVLEENGVMTKSQLTQDFNIWYDENNNSHDKRKKPTAKKVAENVSKMFHSPNGNTWTGVTLKEENENIAFSSNLVSKVGVDEL